MKGKVVAIYIAENPNSNMQAVTEANLVAGKGIEGDRYFTGCGTFSEKLKGNPAVELTLIEKEEIDKFNLEQKQDHDYGDFRRNIITEGFRLNEFINREFTLGSIRLKGIRLCEPCAYLAESVNTLVLPHMVGFAGLRAQIMTGGRIKKNDVISG